jgi:hypothetical protein
MRSHGDTIANMFLKSLVLVLLTLVFCPSSASATSCKPPTLDRAKHSDVVFEAVAKVKLAADHGRRTRLFVKKVYRGEVPKKVTAVHGDMKGYPPFILGRRYLVFASVESPDGDQSKFAPIVFVHLCGATHVLPRKGFFAKGPWIDFDPATSFGAPRAPGRELLAAQPTQPTPAEPSSVATPPAPLPESPQTTATASSPSAAGNSATPDASTSPPSPPPSSVTPPRPAPQASRGCGCELVGGSGPSCAGWWLALVAVLLIPLRRR